MSAADRPLLPIPIEAAQAVAERYGYDSVVIIGRRLGQAPAPHGDSCATYGTTSAHAALAARMGIAFTHQAMVSPALRRVGRKWRAIQDLFEDLADGIEESGFEPLIVAAVVGLLVLGIWRLFISPAHASALQVLETRHATAIGTLLTLLPIVIAVLLMGAALRAALAPQGDDPRESLEEDAR